LTTQPATTRRTTFTAIRALNPRRRGRTKAHFSSRDDYQTDKLTIVTSVPAYIDKDGTRLVPAFIHRFAGPWLLLNVVFGDVEALDGSGTFPALRLVGLGAVFA